MDRNLHTIANFLGVATNVLFKVPLPLLRKMNEALEEDDFMKIHHLGYQLRETISLNVDNG